MAAQEKCCILEYYEKEQKLTFTSPTKNDQFSLGNFIHTVASGKRIDSVSQLSVGDSMVVRIKDGTIKTEVTDIDFTK